MATPFESAQLILKLYELRRDPLLREARTWFIREFHAETIADVQAALASEHNPKLRMVIGYWDMAASLVTTGAIDADAFLAAHGEVFATFGKIQPFLAELRDMSNEPIFCRHLETVVMGGADADDIITRRRNALRAAAKARQSKPDD